MLRCSSNPALHYLPLLTGHSRPPPLPLLLSENGHGKVVHLLLEHYTREEVEHETNFGTTALFMAQRNGNRQIKNLLTEFCLERLSKEKKTKEKRCKNKQNAAMNRLTELKESKKINPEGEVISEGEGARGGVSKR